MMTKETPSLKVLAVTLGPPLPNLRRYQLCYPGSVYLCILPLQIEDQRPCFVFHMHCRGCSGFSSNIVHVNKIPIQGITSVKTKGPTLLSWSTDNNTISPISRRLYGINQPEPTIPFFLPLPSTHSDRPLN